MLKCLFLTVFDHYCTSRHRSTKTVPIVYQQCTNRQKQSKTVKRQSKQQKWPLVYQSSQVYQGFTNSVPIVKNNQKQSKDSKNSKTTVGVPIVTCLLRVRRIHKVRVRVRVRRIHKALRRASIRLAWYRHMPASSLVSSGWLDVMYINVDSSFNCWH